jgi:hypothetical protein
MADGSVVAPNEERFKTLQQGAATSVWCATSAQLNDLGGVYCENCDIAEATPADYTVFMPGISPCARDSELAERLWTLSEKLTGCSLAV